MKTWGVYIAIGLGVIALNALRQADRDGSGAIVGEGNVNAFQIRVGDCYNDTSATFSEEAYEVTEVPGVPCAEPHDNEVFAVFDIDAADFPGDAAMGELAMESCLGRFEPFVGRDYQSSSLDITAMYPTRDSWQRHNDREIICAVYDMSLEKLTSSIRGLAL